MASLHTRWSSFPDCEVLRHIPANWSRDAVAGGCCVGPSSNRQWLAHRWAARYYAEEATRLLALVGMADQGERGCGELAYGDLKRLELAIALASEPKLLLMDEPTAGMAPRERNALMSLTARIVRERTIGVLFTEHDMDVVFEHADRILVLNRGMLIAEGAPAAVRANRQVQAVYLSAGTLHEAKR